MHSTSLHAWLGSVVEYDNTTYEFHFMMINSVWQKYTTMYVMCEVFTY